MNIEFYAPESQVKERLLRHVRFSLIDLYHAYKNISRAEVYFREEQYKQQNDKVCEIHLDIFGDSIFVHERSESYEEAAEQVLSTLGRKIDDMLKKKYELPESILTSVEV